MTSTIQSIEELEAIYNAPAEASLAKVTETLTPEYQQLVEASPFCILATEGPEGLDASPRGDQPGFVSVLDAGTLAMPDRRGNNRIDSLRNIVRTSRIALLFLIPGYNETLRINGTATLSKDPELCDSMAVNNQRPALVILIKTREVYFQCARALIRSSLWDPKHTTADQTLPTAGTMIKAAYSDFDAQTYDRELPARQAKTLYQEECLDREQKGRRWSDSGGYQLRLARLKERVGRGDLASSHH